MFTTVLFDIDGVMLSEERYFDASALTVHELLGSGQLIGARGVEPGFSPTPAEADIRTIRKLVFQQDTVLEQLKNVGVNANWDMVYLLFVAELAGLLKQLPQTPAAQADITSAMAAGWTPAALKALGQIIRTHAPEAEVTWTNYGAVFGAATSKADLFAAAKSVLPGQDGPAADDHALWLLCKDVFQTWYLGDDYADQKTGKSGFLTSEIPLVDPSALGSLFAGLRQRDIQIGIATGRPRIETEVPLRHFGWWSHFDERRVTTASDVLQAETQVPAARPLAKPNPFSYLRSLRGTNDSHELLSLPLPDAANRETVLIVGDSIADGLAARALGASFAAVLTGLEGERARPKFEDLGADYILDHVLALETIL